MSGHDDDTPAALRRAYAEGRIDRDAFWRRMRDHHRRLMADTPLPEDGEVAAIAQSADGPIARLKSGLCFRWNPENLREPVSVAINHGAYEPFAGRVLEACATGASLIADAGANIGWYTVRLAAAMSETGRVMAFEPVGETRVTLEANIALNRLGDRVTVIGAGLSDRSGEAEIFLPQDTGHVGASLQDLHPEEPSRRIRIRLTTLDAALSEAGPVPLDLLKCDVEGAELMVLTGGHRVIGRDRPVLFLELLRKWSAAFGYHPNDVIAHTREFGYACWAVGDDALRPCQSVDDNTVETNYLFVQPDRDAALIGELAGG